MKAIEYTDRHWLHCVNDGYVNSPASSSDQSAKYSDYKLHIGLPVAFFETHQKRLYTVLKQAVETGVIPWFKRANCSDLARAADIAGNARLLNNPFTIWLFPDYDTAAIATLCRQIEGVLQEVPLTGQAHLSAADLELTPHVSFRRESLQGEYVSIAHAAPAVLQTLKEQGLASREYQTLREACSTVTFSESGEDRKKELAIRGFYNANYSYFSKEFNSDLMTRQYQAALDLLNIDREQFLAEKDPEKKKNLIKDKYRTAAKMYHPDKIRNPQYQDTLEKSTALFKLFTSASELLQKTVDEPELLDAALLLRQEAHRAEYQYELRDGYVDDPYFYIRMASSSADVLLRKNWSFEYVPEVLTDSEGGTAIQVFRPNLQKFGESLQRDVTKKGYKAFFYLCMANALPKRFDRGHFEMIFDDYSAFDRPLDEGKKWLLKKVFTTPELFSYLKYDSLMRLAEKLTLGQVIQVGTTANEVLEYIYTHLPETLSNELIERFRQAKDFDAERAKTFFSKNPDNLRRVAGSCLGALYAIWPEITKQLFASESFFRSWRFYIESDVVVPFFRAQEKVRDLANIKQLMHVAIMQAMGGNYQFLTCFSDEALHTCKTFVTQHKAHLPLWINDAVDVEIERRKKGDTSAETVFFQGEYFDLIEAYIFLRKTFFSGDSSIVTLLNRETLIWLAEQPETNDFSRLPIAGALAAMGETQKAMEYRMQAATALGMDIQHADADVLQALLRERQTDIDEALLRVREQTRQGAVQRYQETFFSKDEAGLFEMRYMLEIYGIPREQRRSIQNAHLDAMKPQMNALLQRLRHGEMTPELQQDFDTLRQRVMCTTGWVDVKDARDTWSSFSTAGVLTGKMRNCMYLLLGVRDANEIWWRYSEKTFQDIHGKWGIDLGADILTNYERIFHIFACLGQPEAFYRCLQQLTRLKEDDNAFAGLTTFDREAVHNRLLRFADNELAVTLDGRRENARYKAHRFLDPQNVRPFPQLLGVYTALGELEHLKAILPPEHQHLLEHVVFPGPSSEASSSGASSLPPVKTILPPAHQHLVVSSGPLSGGSSSPVRTLTHGYNKNREHHLNRGFNYTLGGVKASVLRDEERLGLSALDGDALKWAILDRLTAKLNRCPREEAAALITRIRNSKEYAILKTRQYSCIPDGAVRLFSLWTTSIEALEDLINRTEDALSLERSRPSTV